MHKWRNITTEEEAAEIAAKARLKKSKKGRRKKDLQIPATAHRSSTETVPQTGTETVPQTNVTAKSDPKKNGNSAPEKIHFSPTVSVPQVSTVSVPKPVRKPYRKPHSDTAKSPNSSVRKPYHYIDIYPSTEPQAPAEERPQSQQQGPAPAAAPQAPKPTKRRAAKSARSPKNQTAVASNAAADNGHDHRPEKPCAIPSQQLLNGQAPKQVASNGHRDPSKMTTMSEVLDAMRALGDAKNKDDQAHLENLWKRRDELMRDPWLGRAQH
jgi:hypothetical protein